MSGNDLDDDLMQDRVYILVRVRDSSDYLRQSRIEYICRIFMNVFLKSGVKHVKLLFSHCHDLRNKVPGPIFRIQWLVDFRSKLKPEGDYAWKSLIYILSPVTQRSKIILNYELCGLSNEIGLSLLLHRQCFLRFE